MSYSTKIFDDNAAIARFLGEKLALLSHSKEAVYLALSGGNTPKAIFEIWSREFSSKIKWENLYLFWGDERCVPPNDPDSNYGMTAKALLNQVAIPEKNIFRIEGELSPQEAASNYIQVIDNQIPKKNDIPIFNIIFLGLGDDGHTVSIFPHQQDLWQSTNFCEVATHPISGQKRVTITGAIINAAHEVIFVVTGSGKKQVVMEILTHCGNWHSYPASKVSNRNALWALDKMAAEFLIIK